jgi:hypothetical protein
MSRRSSWRTSTFSNTAQTDRSYTTIDIGVQTDFDTPATSPSGSNSTRNAKMTDILERKSEDRQKPMSEEAPQTSIDALPTRQKEETIISNGITAGRNDSLQGEKDLTEQKPQLEEPTTIPTIAHIDVNDAQSDDEEEEEAVIHTIQQAATPQRPIQARLVSVKKQAPPALPPRNPIRDRKRPLIITGDNLHDDDSKDQGTSTMSRDASLSSVYKSEVEEASSGHSLSSVDFGEEMKNDRPLRPSADEVEARSPSPTKGARSPSPVLRSQPPSPRKSSRSPSPAKKSRPSSPIKQSMPGQF